MTKTSYSLEELAAKIGASVQGDADLTISAVATLAKAQAGQISFLTNAKYKKDLESSKASAVLLNAETAKSYDGNALVMDDPYVGFAKVAQLFDDTPAPATQISAHARIDERATLGQNVSIGPNAVIEADVVLGDNVSIGAGTYVGQGSTLGKGSKLRANVTIYHGVHIGEHCEVHSGTVIGCDGFGYANEKGEWVKIPQTGGVRIGDRVDIGSGTTIDRGALDDTVIESNVIIDNQIQIAHNCHIGYGTVIAGASNVAGSTVIGKYCIIGGLVGISGHITIVDGVTITGRTMVTSSITEKGVYSSGMPHMKNRDWRRLSIRNRQLDDLFGRVKQLEKSSSSDS